LQVSDELRSGHHLLLDKINQISSLRDAKLDLVFKHLDLTIIEWSCNTSIITFLTFWWWHIHAPCEVFFKCLKIFVQVINLWLQVRTWVLCATTTIFEFINSCNDLI